MIMPALMFVIMVMVQLGLWYHASNVASAAAQQGARAARIDGGTEPDGEQAAARLLDGVATRLITGRRVDVAIDRSANVARVEVSGDVISVIPPIFPFPTLTVREVSEGPLERFRSPAEP